MIRTLTATEAATLAGVTIVAVRRMCRTGVVAAAKVHGRWAVDAASLLRSLNRPARRPADRLRKGDAAPQRTGRAARTRVGHHMSVARRYAVLDALCGRLNGATVTALSYLRDVIGADRTFINRYAAAFGKKAAEAYQAVTGRKAAQDGLDYGRGRYWDCFAYRADELWALEAGARAYKRTAALLASQ